jgi:hypothetical protein
MDQVPPECEKLIEAIYASFLANLCDTNNCVNAVVRQQFQTILKSEIPGGPELVALVDGAVWPEFLGTYGKDIQEDCQSTDAPPPTTTVCSVYVRSYTFSLFTFVHTRFLTTFFYRNHASALKPFHSLLLNRSWSLCKLFAQLVISP